jgi:hypothetical protein
MDPEEVRIRIILGYQYRSQIHGSEFYPCILQYITIGVASKRILRKYLRNKQITIQKSNDDIFCERWNSDNKLFKFNTANSVD